MAKWGNLNTRGNVDDRRGLAPMVGGIGLTGAILITALTLFTGGDLGDVISILDTLPVQTPPAPNAEQFVGEDEYEVFASTVLGSANAMWHAQFAQLAKDYPEPTLVLFREATQSACGGATSAVGPHYCFVDQTIYLDETFFDELSARFGAEGGDVAEAYVIAHEVGHHVQYALGYLEENRRQQQRQPRRANELSIALELQADCFAGLWAHSIRDQAVFEEGEIREAMDAAAAVGDDRIQQTVTGRVNPESWTHGSSEQRVEWFMRGYERGELAACETQ